MGQGMSKSSETPKEGDRLVAQPSAIESDIPDVQQAQLAGAVEIRAFLETNQNLHDGSAGGDSQESIQIVALDENGKERILAQRPKVPGQNDEPETMDTSTLLAVEAKTNPVAKVIALFRNWIEKLPAGRQKEEYRELSRQQAKELSPEIKDKLTNNELVRRGSEMLAAIEKYQHEQSERRWGQLIGTVQGAGEVAINLAKIADFSAALIKGDKETAEKMGAEFGTSLGKTIVSGIQLFQATDRYLYDVGFSGDYAKPFKDISTAASILNQRWSELPPREQERLKAKIITELVADGLIGMASANTINKSSKFTEMLDIVALEARELANKSKNAGKKAIQSIGATVEEILTPAGDTGLGVKVKIPRDTAEEIRNDTKMLMTGKGWEFASGRLRRTDLGPPRPPYSWPVIDEKFTDEVVRQSTRETCVSAVGEMLCRGKLREVDILDKLGSPADIEKLSEVLGPPWTSQTKKSTSLAEIGKHGSWAAEMLDNAHTSAEKSLHVVVVDGPGAFGNIIIRDPWEGTTYEMRIKDFLRVWTTRSFYRTAEELD